MTSSIALEKAQDALRYFVKTPSRARWKRFMASFTLDPQLLPSSLNPPGDRDFFICGVPRSGTTLACAALYQPPTCVTLMEPWDGLRLLPNELFRSVRAEIAASGKLSRGKLNVPRLLQVGAVEWWTEGRHAVTVETGSEYLVGVKWPTFWQYLDRFPSTKFVVCVRHPVDVIASFMRNGGSITRGFDYDVAFNRRMNTALRRATSDITLRRILLHEYINRQILPHLNRANTYLLRYERWFSEPDKLMQELSEFLGADVSSPRVSIRPSREEPSLSPIELALVRQHCSSAESLGYSL